MASSITATPPERSPGRSRPAVRLGLSLALALVAALATLALAQGASGASFPGRTAPPPQSASGGPPPLLLPWQDGQEWRTGISGFHTVSDALDFFPPDTPLGGGLMCEGDPGWAPAESALWAVAAAAGTVVQASDSLVLIDHGNGWVTGYYHIHSFQVMPGDAVPPKWALGHPSTYGNCTTGPHVHFYTLGPNGKTLRDLNISGRAAAGININEVISDTGNFPPGPQPTVTPTPTSSPAPTPSPTLPPVPVLKGDVNCDGVVNSVDGLLVLRSVADLPDAGAGCLPTAGDVDCNGVVDAVDALHILRYVAQLSPRLPAQCPAAAP